MLYTFNNIKVITDAEGYLINSKNWNEKIATEIARLEGLTLNKAHWEIIYFIRTFYLQYNVSPAVRMLVKIVEQKFGKEKGTSRYLFHLFPQGPSKQATKIAGLPKPIKCL